MPNLDDLSVWHFPQVPGEMFRISAHDLEEAVAIQDAIAFYDLFLCDNGFRPDFSNASGIARWESDGIGGYDWYDVDEYDLPESGLSTL